MLPEMFTHRVCARSEAVSGIEKRCILYRIASFRFDFRFHRYVAKKCLNVKQVASCVFSKSPVALNCGKLV